MSGCDLQFSTSLARSVSFSDREIIQKNSTVESAQFQLNGAKIVPLVCSFMEVFDIGWSLNACCLSCVLLANIWFCSAFSSRPSGDLDVQNMYITTSIRQHYHGNTDGAEITHNTAVALLLFVLSAAASSDCCWGNLWLKKQNRSSTNPEAGGLIPGPCPHN